MSDNTAIKPSGKILFGVDYLNLMRFMELPEKSENYDRDKQNIVDGVARLFLLQWDFSVDEIDQTNNVFWEKVNSHTLDQSIIVVIDRIVDFLKDDKKAQERFIVEVAAVALMDDTFIENEAFIRDVLQEKFDFRPSEITKLFEKGWGWRIALDYVGEQYIELATKKKKQIDNK